MLRCKFLKKLLYSSTSTVLLRQEDVPEYLQGSPFYQNIDWTERDTSVAVPFNCMKKNVEVLCVADAVHLLETLRFWCATELPDSVVVFCINYRRPPKALERFHENFSELKVFSAPNTHEALLEAIKLKNMRFMRLFAECKYKYKESDVRLAVEVDFSEFLLSVLPTFQPCYIREWAILAAESGSLRCLAFFIEQRETYDISLEELWKCGILYNQVSVLQLLYNSKAGLESIAFVEQLTRTAIKLGKVEVLAFLSSTELLWCDFACSLAAKYGQLGCLKYLHENGVPWNTGCFKWAALDGNLPLVQYLHEQGAPYDLETMIYAAGRPGVQCLQYLHEQLGYELTVEVAEYAAQNSHYCDGTPDCLNYLIDHGCPLSQEVPQKLDLEYASSFPILWKLYRANCPAPDQGREAAFYFRLFDYLTKGTPLDNTASSEDKSEGFPGSLLTQVEDEWGAQQSADVFATFQERLNVVRERFHVY